MSDIIDKAVQLLEDDQYTECFQVMAAEIERLRKALENNIWRNADQRNAVIEECARVAQSFHAYDHPAKPIAAAIRALKH